MRRHTVIVVIGSIVLWCGPKEKAKAGEVGRFVAVKPLGPGVNSATFDMPESVSPDGKKFYFSSIRPLIGTGVLEGALYDALDIYVATRQGPDEPFGNAEKLAINSTSSDFGFTMTRDERELFFVSNRAHPNKVSAWDLFMAKQAEIDQTFSEPEPLPAPVNSTAVDGMPCLSYDGLSLYFNSNRDGGHGGFDLYVAKRNDARDGFHDQPQNVGPDLNSLLGAADPVTDDADPVISRDGQTIFLCDATWSIPGLRIRPNGHGCDDIWWSWRADPQGVFPAAENIGPPVCTEFYDFRPVISFDWPDSESVLYFGSDRPHPLACGGCDVFQATWLASANVVSEVEEPRMSGAVNCGGWEVAALGITFEEDRFFDAEVGWSGNEQAGFVVTRTVFGRTETTWIARSDNHRQIDVSQIPGAGEDAKRLFATETRSHDRIHYRARVVPGRYEVTLYFAESSLEAVNGLGQGTRLVNALINGEKVLCNWSAAAAAGGGEPGAPCTAVIDTAVSRTYELDVSEDTLDIVVDDLGGGTPPGDAALNALSFRRVGDRTGEPLAGIPNDDAIECFEPDPEDPADSVLQRARDRWKEGQGELSINCGGPLLDCGTHQNPAPGALAGVDPGSDVVWIADLAGGGRTDIAQNEFFSVTPLNDWVGLQVAATDMGSWYARGTEVGLDQNDRIFHTARFGAVEYEIPVVNGTYDVTLYFANIMRETAGTGLRFFQIEIEGQLQGGFAHCEFMGGVDPANRNPNPAFEYDHLYDPVDQAEHLYGKAACDAFEPCDPIGVTAEDDPDEDGIPASLECGNAAVTAVTARVEVNDTTLTVKLLEPDPGDPPAQAPTISAITVRPRPGPGIPFVRGDANADAGVNVADAVYVLQYIFLGGEAPSCLDTADTNDDDQVNIADGIYVLQYLFLNGPDLPPPFPDCGMDQTPDNLGCVAHPPCGQP